MPLLTPMVIPVLQSDDQELLRLRQENESLRQSNEGLQQCNESLQQSFEILQERISELQQQLRQSFDGNTELKNQMSDLQTKLDNLIIQLDKRNRRDFGQKTERHNPRQASGPTAEAATSEQAPEAGGSTNHKKHILFQNLPNQPVPHTVKQEDLLCPRCLVQTVFVRHEVTYQLERLLHSLVRLEHQQEIRACPKCKEHVVTAEKPCPPIPGALPGPCLLSDVIVSKFADGLPNFRQQKIFKREQAIIPRSTQSDWVIAASLTLEPLYDRLKLQVLGSKVIQTDDSELKIQDRKHEKNIRKGKMTVYRGDERHPSTVFDFSPDQSFARNKKFLQDFTGFVQADAATGFDALFQDGTKTEIGCGAHSRRRYFECQPVYTKDCDEILDIYRKLYKVEKEIKGKEPAERLAMRQAKSKPLCDELHEKVLALRGTLNPTSKLMEAVNYTLNHWIALTRFLDEPDFEVDNNLCEQTIKEFVLVRKNALFTGSDAGGRAAAIHLSFMASCKRNNVDPLAYLSDVFARINSMKTSELDQLLPDRWTPTKQSKPPPS